CWSPHAREFCRRNPDLVTIVADDGFVLLGRVQGYEGATIRGMATVEAEPGRLVVRGISGGGDGLVVLRYHSVPCLRSRPPVLPRAVSRGHARVRSPARAPRGGPVPTERDCPPYRERSARTPPGGPLPPAPLRGRSAPLSPPTRRFA